MTGNRRVRGLIRKEFLQILRDPSSIAIAFLMPVFLLLLFGYGLSLDAENIPLAVVVEQPSAETARFTSQLNESRYLASRNFPGMRAAENALRRHEVDGIVHLRADFGADLAGQRETGIQVIVNGVDANTARMVLGYLNGAWKLWLRQGLPETQSMAVPGVDVQPRIWYNSEVSQSQLPRPGPDRRHHDADRRPAHGAGHGPRVGARHDGSADGNASHHDRGVARQTHARTSSWAWAAWCCRWLWPCGCSTCHWPARPSSCSPPPRFSCWSPWAWAWRFPLTARNQFVAGLIAIIVTFLPAFILSGFIFDIDSMPGPVRLITHLVAARYFIAIIQTVFLAGNIWPVILPNAAALLLMAVVFLGIVHLRSRKRLD